LWGGQGVVLVEEKILLAELSQPAPLTSAEQLEGATLKLSNPEVLSWEGVLQDFGWI